jgi:PAS domain S-box-containing protein
MDTEQAELPKILEVLRENPRGMSVRQIAEAIGMNRISVARYLDILLTSGQVDMVRYGQAKLYYITHRVPVSALLDFSSDYVVILGSNQKIVQVNSNFEKLLNRKRDDIIEKPLEDVLHPLSPDINLGEFIEKAVGGEEVSEEICIIKDDKELYFQMKILPAVFADGAPGTTIILEDITEEKQSMEALIKSEQKFRTLVEHISDLLINIEKSAYLNDQIRDPLQAIVGIADLEGGTELTEKIFQQAQAIDEIITTLDIGRMEAENIREFFRKHYGVPITPKKATAAKSEK